MLMFADTTGYMQALAIHLEVADFHSSPNLIF